MIFGNYKKYGFNLKKMIFLYFPQTYTEMPYIYGNVAGSPSSSFRSLIVLLSCCGFPTGLAFTAVERVNCPELASTSAQHLDALGLLQRHQGSND